MTGITAVAVLSVVGVVGLILVAHATASAVQPSLRDLFRDRSTGGVDRELASVLDQGTAELTAERLAEGPLLVPVRIGHGLLGPFLLVDLGWSCLRLRLYNERRIPVAPGGECGGFARLRDITYSTGQGWRFVFDGPVGPQRYLGWLVETLDRRGSALA